MTRRHTVRDRSRPVLPVGDARTVADGHGRLRQRPRSPARRLERIQTLLDEHRYTEAISLARQLRHQCPDLLQNSLMLAHACRMLGACDEARSVLETALTYHPHDAHALCHLTLVDRQPPAHPRFQQARRALELATRDPDRAMAHFALARMHEYAGDHDHAFTEYHAGNACLHRDLACRGQAFDRSLHRAEIDAAIEYFNPGFFADRRDCAVAVRHAPILVLGVSRAGKTLHANILASHPLLANLDERPELGRLALRWAPALAGRTGSGRREVAHRFATDYVRSLAVNAGRHVHALDTNPLNIRALGLLGCALPAARIIYVERDRRDLLLANYFTAHRGISHAYSCDLADCLSYIDDYARLMRHWQSVMPDAIHVISYEAMVEDTDRITREALSFLGLEWHESCGSGQVRAPAIDLPTPAPSPALRTEVVSDHVGFSRHYERQLSEILPDALLSGSIDQQRDR